MTAIDRKRRHKSDLHLYFHLRTQRQWRQWRLAVWYHKLKCAIAQGILPAVRFFSGVQSFWQQFGFVCLNYLATYYIGFGWNVRYLAVGGLQITAMPPEAKVRTSYIQMYVQTFHKQFLSRGCWLNFCRTRVNLERELKCLKVTTQENYSLFWTLMRMRIKCVVLRSSTQIWKRMIYHVHLVYSVIPLPANTSLKSFRLYAFY